VNLVAPVEGLNPGCSLLVVRFAFSLFSFFLSKQLARRAIGGTCSGVWL